MDILTPALNQGKINQTLKSLSIFLQKVYYDKIWNPVYIMKKNLKKIDFYVCYLKRTALKNVEW